VDETEMYHVFNLGIGMTLIVSAEKADAVLRAVNRGGVEAWSIGEIVRGRGTCRVV